MNNDPIYRKVKEVNEQINRRRHDVVKAALREFYGVHNAYDVIYRTEVVLSPDGECYIDSESGEVIIDITKTECSGSNLGIVAAFRAAGNDRVMKAIKGIK